MEPSNDDPFLREYQPSDLKIASEFLTTWLPFLTKDLCKDCIHVLSHRIRSLDQEYSSTNTKTAARDDKPVSDVVVKDMDSEETDHNNLEDDRDGKFSASETVSPKMSWADMTQEDGLDEEQEELKVSEDLRKTTPQKRKLSREEREQYRFMNVKRMKVFSCFEKVKGRRVDILEGLELHTGVFSAVEQKRIVDYVYELQEKGRKRELQGYQSRLGKWTSRKDQSGSHLNLNCKGLSHCHTSRPRRVILLLLLQPLSLQDGATTKMVVTTTVEEVDTEKDGSTMSREEAIINLRVESGHHQVEEEEVHDTLLIQSIDPRFIHIMLDPTMFE